MPANLTPEYMAAEAKFRSAKNPEEKLLALREMLKTVPKHKGTEKLQADIKRRISQLKKESLKKSGAAKKMAFFLVDREGAGQVYVVGAANTGKSQLMTALTNARSEVAPYPYSTPKPVPGMMQFENIQIQLVDTPPIERDFMEGWLPGIIRNGDLVLLLTDLSGEDPLDQIELVMERLNASKLQFVKGKKAERMEQGIMLLPLIIVGNKLDTPDAPDNASIIQELYGEKYETVFVSAQHGTGLDDLKRRIYLNLHLTRVYTKSPGKKTDFNDPVILNEGDTVMDFAREIHKDFSSKLKFAKIWGKDMYDGQRVNRDFVLRDGDVLELHM